MTASGQDIARKNVMTFATWAASKTDHDFRAMTSRGVLSRKEIAIECGFAKSALDQNPRIKASLHELEDKLRIRGVLPQLAEKNPEVVAQPQMREVGPLRASLDTDRLRRLENDNAMLKAENDELKRQLEKHSILREALALTGRLPR
jgi:hypothetical protein